MKKILFISSRDPFSNNFSGDRLRASKIIKYLSKKNQVDLAITDKKSSKNINVNVKKFFFKNNILKSFLNTFLYFLKLKPLQVGFFYSRTLKKFVKENHNNYDIIICHLIRTVEYLPKEFKGKKILEMTDLYSDNYKQTYRKLSFLNPLFYLYFVESLLTRKYEKKCFHIFDKIVLVSKKDIKKSKNISSIKKISYIPMGVDSNKNIFSFKKNNNKIIFIGNIKYLPNKIACLNFANNILPRINVYNKNIKFIIIGEISNLDKNFLLKNKNIKVLGSQKNLKTILKNSICGISNLNISTGFQSKILTYMSFGLPVICSLKSFNETGLKKNKEILVYKNNFSFINLILRLKENKIKSNMLSINGLKTIKLNYNWNKILFSYIKIK